MCLTLSAFLLSMFEEGFLWSGERSGEADVIERASEMQRAHLRPKETSILILPSDPAKTQVLSQSRKAQGTHLQK